MSEINDLLIIAGAVDAVVASVEFDDPLRREVANLVPPYRVGDRSGWYEEFIDGPWYQEFIARQEREERDVERMPNLADQDDRVEAVREAVVSSAARPRFASMPPRRLLAIALVARICPDQFRPGGAHEAEVLNALMVPEIIAGPSPVPTPPPPGPPETPD